MTTIRDRINNTPKGSRTAELWHAWDRGEIVFIDEINGRIEDKQIESELTKQKQDSIPPSIKRAITRFDKAAQEYAFKGSFRIETAEEIEQEYEAARRSLEGIIAKALRRKK